jgi:hypothetical protein
MSGLPQNDEKKNTTFYAGMAWFGHRKVLFGIEAVPLWARTGFQS